MGAGRRGAREGTRGESRGRRRQGGRTRVSAPARRGEAEVEVAAAAGRLSTRCAEEAHPSQHPSRHPGRNSVRRGGHAMRRQRRGQESRAPPCSSSHRRVRSQSTARSASSHRQRARQDPEMALRPSHQQACPLHSESFLPVLALLVFRSGSSATISSVRPRRSFTQGPHDSVRLSSLQ